MINKFSNQPNYFFKTTVLKININFMLNWNYIESYKVLQSSYSSKNPHFRLADPKQITLSQYIK